MDIDHNSKNILSEDVVIKGSIKYEGELIVDGRIEGEVISNGNLTVGDNAHIKGEIKTSDITLYGKVEGDINVTNMCDIRSSAELHGDLTAERFSIQEGAAFWGNSRVGKPPQKEVEPKVVVEPPTPEEILEESPESTEEQVEEISEELNEEDVSEVESSEDEDQLPDEELEEVK